jgi:hypothetical protein
MKKKGGLVMEMAPNGMPEGFSTRCGAAGANLESAKQCTILLKQPCWPCCDANHMARDFKMNNRGVEPSGPSRSVYTMNRPRKKTILKIPSKS